MQVGPLTILLGADPECFIYNKEFDRPVSAVGIIPGDKANPFKVEKGAVQCDGLAAEFNIDPAATEDEWVENLTTVLAQMNSMLPDGHEFRFQPTAYFTKEHFNKQPDEAKELGCDPDYNAWSSQQNPVPGIKMVAKGMLRTAAGHIHIGWTEGADVASPEHIAKCEILVKLMDRYIGAPMVLSKGNQEEKRRRKLYGKAGAYRPKTYGVEYRTASNNWLTSEEKMRWAYRNTILCIERMLEGERAANKYGGVYGRELIGSINKGYSWNIATILQGRDVFKAVPDFPVPVKESGRY